VLLLSSSRMTLPYSISALSISPACRKWFARSRWRAFLDSFEQPAATNTSSMRPMISLGYIDRFLFQFAQEQEQQKERDKGECKKDWATPMMQGRVDDIRIYFNREPCEG